LSVADIKVPRLAESISEAVLVQWLKQDGEAVRVDEPIATLETDKAAVEIPSDTAGVLHHAKAVGDTVHVGDVLAQVDESGAAASAAATSTPAAKPEATSKPAPAAAPKATAPAPASKPAAAPPPRPAPAAPPPRPAAAPAPAARATEPTFGPAVRRMTEEHGISPNDVTGTGPRGRVLKEDVQREVERRGAAPSPAAQPPRAPEPAPKRAAAPAATTPTPAPRTAADWQDGETERAVPMSRIRQKIAERLVQAQHTAAILTTFNEVDMGPVMELRARYKESFEQRHGVKLSYMSFFSRACILALQQLPEVNSEIRGTDLVYKRHVNLGIAVGTERGLVVPVVHEADQRSFAELEREIARLALRARENKLSLDELSGGTFSISNGGVYGSLLSTPILNPPQSAILGMHKIEKRPIVVDDEIVIRSVMYLALSYDHRVIDGEQAVTFLVGVKQRLEDPERLLLEV
jgi:2-oxoglutarate dehydrogenase E2 component (dihydrolipoamide succinyltransferase)